MDTKPITATGTDTIKSSFATSDRFEFPESDGYVIAKLAAPALAAARDAGHTHVKLINVNEYMTMHDSQIMFEYVAEFVPGTVKDQA